MISVDKFLRVTCLFAHWSSSADVKSYVYTYLDGIKEIATDIFFISNSSISECSKNKLQESGVKVVIRDNKGYDFGAWKDQILNMDLKKIDRLILCNNSCYGPFYSLKEIFSSPIVNSDFWSITKHKKNFGLAEHLQSYFLVFEKPLLTSPIFKKYWENIPYFKSWNDAVHKGEINLTSFFSSEGFTYNSFIREDILSNRVGNPTIFFPLELLKMGAPFIKRKVFSEDYRSIISVTNGHAPSEFLEFIENRFPQLYKNIMDDLKTSLSPSRLSLCTNSTLIVSCDGKSQNNNSIKVGVIFYVYYKEETEFVLSYIRNILSFRSIMILVVSPKSELLNFYEEKLEHNNVRFLKHKNIGRSESALLVTCKPFLENIDVFCFVHDKNSYHIRPRLISYTFMEHCFVNLLGSKNYVLNVINKFIENKSLGMLVPPAPVFSNYELCIENPYGPSLEITRDLSRRIGCQSFDEAGLLIPFGGMFWARTDALKPLLNLNLQYESFPKEPIKLPDGTLLHGIERVYPLSAFRAGYTVNRIINSEYLSTHLNQIYFKLWNDQRRSIKQQLASSLKARIKNKPILYKFCKFFYVKMLRDKLK